MISPRGRGGGGAGEADKSGKADRQPATFPAALAACRRRSLSLRRVDSRFKSPPSHPPRGLAVTSPKGPAFDWTLAARGGKKIPIGDD